VDLDLDTIRRLVIQAAFADDALTDQLVLKGGNALALVYGIGNRSSIDVDFSLAADFDEGGYENFYVVLVILLLQLVLGVGPLMRIG